MHNSFRVAFCIGAEEGELARKLRTVLERFRLPVYTDRSGGSSNVKFVVCSRHLHTICGAIGDGADKKALPAPIFRLERRFAEALVAGYRATDGSTREAKRMPKGNVLQARWKIASVSLQLLRGMQRLLLRLGTFAAIHHCWKGGPQLIEGRSVSTKPRWELCVSLDPKKRTTFEFIDGAVWIRIRRVEKRQTAQEVWNLEIAEDDTYCSLSSPRITARASQACSAMRSHSPRSTKHSMLSRFGG